MAVPLPALAPLLLMTHFHPAYKSLTGLIRGYLVRAEL